MRPEDDRDGLGVLPLRVRANVEGAEVHPGVLVVRVLGLRLQPQGLLHQSGCKAVRLQRRKDKVQAVVLAQPGGSKPS